MTDQPTAPAATGEDAYDDRVLDPLWKLGASGFDAYKIGLAFQETWRATVARAERAEAENAELRKDAERLAELLTGRCEITDTRRDAIFACELRCLSGDYPTLDEWREAIDAALGQERVG